MKIKLLCSKDGCDHEVDPDPSDEVYAIGELQKIDRLCTSCQIKKDQQEQQERKARKEGVITDILGNLLSVHVKLDGIRLEGSLWRANLRNMSEDDLRDVAARTHELLELVNKV